MAKRRHTKNPAKLKADAEARAQRREQETQGDTPRRRRWLAPLLCMLTVVLLSVSFPPFDLWFLAYMALVPWALATILTRRVRWTLLWATLAGTIFWAANLYWLWWITLVGYGALVAYLTVYWLLSAVIVRSAGRRGWPMFIVLPVLWVALEYARAYLLSGFTWFYLAHTQYEILSLIQISDITGVYGVSFLVAMVNGAIVDVVRTVFFVSVPERRKASVADEPRAQARGVVQPSKSPPACAGGSLNACRRIVSALVAPLVLAAAMLAYGAWQLSRETKSPGPVVGIAQGDFPITLYDAADFKTSQEDRFLAYVDLLRRFIPPDAAAKGKIDLAVLPESAMPEGINSDFLFDPRLKETDYVHKARGYAAEVGALSRQLGCPILTGAATVHEEPDDPGELLLRNSTLMLGADGRSDKVYSKMHLVPFSEYVPFKKSWSGLHELLRRFVPPVMPQLDPGPRVVRFELPRDDREGRWRLVTPICFEGTFARDCRNLVMEDGEKAADILLNLSNDGWFVYNPGRFGGAGGQYRSSTEHYQHLSQYVFRAIETRVPILRAANTGISAYITSDGRIDSIIEYRGNTMIRGTLLLDGKKRNAEEYVEGHGGKVLVDDRRSVYSLYGDVFAQAVTLAAIAAAGWLVFTRERGKKGQQT